MVTDTRDERIAKLEARLAKGFIAIGEATAEHIDVTNWERAWIELLREYESLEDEIAAHHAETAPVQGRLLDAPVVRAEDEFNADRILEDLIPDLIEFLGPRVLNIEDASWMWGTENGSDHDSEVRNMRTWLEFLRRAQAFRKVVADASA